MKATLFALASLVSVCALACAEVDESEESDGESAAELELDVDVGEQGKPGGSGDYCAAACLAIYRNCIAQGNPQSVCYSQYQACLQCQ